VYLSDAGPDHRAARRPVREPARIVRLLMNLWRRYPDRWTIAPALVGGFPGIVVEMPDRVHSVTGVEVVEGRIVRISSVLNPAKLAGTERGRASIE
jgi:hypothetical protein